MALQSENMPSNLITQSDWGGAASSGSMNEKRLTLIISLLCGAGYFFTGGWILPITQRSTKGSLALPNVLHRLPYVCTSGLDIFVQNATRTRVFFFFFGVKFSKLKITIGGFWAMVSICTGDVPEWFSRSDIRQLCPQRHTDGASNHRRIRSKAGVWNRYETKPVGRFSGCIGYGYWL